MASPSSLPRTWQPQPAPSLTRSTEPSMENVQSQNQNLIPPSSSQPRPSASIEETPQHNNNQNAADSIERAKQQQQQLSNLNANSTSGYQPGYFKNRQNASSSSSLPREQQHPLGAPSYNQLTIDMEELRIKLQSEKSRANHAEEALIRKDKELDRVREDLERYQREALKGSTSSASLEAELTATKVQLSEALASRDATMKSYRDLQTQHRQVESTRETAMQQLQELTHELEMVRRASEDKTQPLTQMLSQLTNRLANIEETRRQHSSQSRSRAREDSTNNNTSVVAIREMQQNIVDEALSRYESQSQKGRDLQSMLEESEKIKHILKGQLEVAQSQIATLETKFRATAEVVEKHKDHLSQCKWLLLQRRWLSQLIFEYDTCFKLFPSVLPWFRMPQRKCFRVYVWAVIAALRIVKGVGCLSDNLPQFKRFFAISAAKCSPAAVFRKIQTEIDQLNNNNSASNNNNNNSSPVAHLPGNGTLVVHSSGHQQNQQQQQQSGRNFVFPSSTTTNSNDSSSASNIHENNNTGRWGGGGGLNNSNNNSVVGGTRNPNNTSYFGSGYENTSTYNNHHHHHYTTSTNASTTSTGVNVDPDDITAILSEIHTIDSRISRALRAHGDHIITGSGGACNHFTTSYSNRYSGNNNNNSSVLNYANHNDNDAGSRYSSSSNTTIMFAP